MAEYTGPATSNQADVIANNEGHRVADVFATDDQDKLGGPHAKKIHNDIHRRYGQDEPEGYSC